MQCREMALQCRCAYSGAPIQVDSVSIAAPACANDDGAVAFHISNSCGPFSYAWIRGPVSGSALQDLAPGAV